jgi:hypothetical protein
MPRRPRTLPNDLILSVVAGDHGSWGGQEPVTSVTLLKLETD